MAQQTKIFDEAQHIKDSFSIEQIKEMWSSARQTIKMCREFGCNHNDPETAEQYYNETFGGQGSPDTTTSLNTQNK